MDDVVIYTVGFCYCSVCAQKDVPIDKVVARTNVLHPTGLSHGWELDEKGEVADETPMPSPCNQDKDRTHYLLSC